MTDFPQLAQHDLGAAFLTNAEHHFPLGSVITTGDVVRHGIDVLVTNCHAASYNRGWWHDPITGLSLIPGGLPIDPDHDLPNNIIKAWFPYVIGTKIALIHSETSEAFEAFRVDAKDDKIDFPGVTAEMADVVIRIADLMGCLRYAADNGIIIDGYVVDGKIVLAEHRNSFNLGAAIMAKIPFNATRPDHDLAKRALPGQKKY